MKKKVSVLVMCFLIAFTLLPVTARADTGPKPSVRITFENMDDEICYGTLLSKERSTGPASAWDGNPEHIYNSELNHDIWQAFVDYDDEDGYYFLQRGWLCSVSKELNWTYYPPQSFKILLYYPETDSYAVSGIYERYAFDSYFTVNMDGVEIGSVNLTGTPIVAVKSYDYTWEIISLICRILFTILLELGIAWLFNIRQRRPVKTILRVNVVTQIVLNVALNIANYRSGGYAFIAYYVLFEAAVLVCELCVYLAVLPRQSSIPISQKRIVLYTVIANIVSFVGGMGIAKLIPGIF